MKKIGIVLIVVVLGLVGYRYIQSRSDSSGRRGRPVVATAVEIEPVRKASIADEGFFTGTLTPRASYRVAPKVSGAVQKIMVDIGDRVSRGQLVAVLDDEEYKLELEQAEAQLDVATANRQESQSSLDTARREFERIKSLFQKKVASESDYDLSETKYKAAQARYRVSEAQVAKVESELKTARVRLDYTQIRVAWEGGSDTRAVGERFVDEGALLKTNDPIVSILDDGVLTAVVHVIERDYPRIKIGQEALLDTDAYPGRTFTGQVARLAPLLREASRQARMEIEIENKDTLLKPGMFIRAKVEFDRHGQATVVPMSALANREGRQGVFVADLEAMTAVFVPVTTGIVTSTLAEVLSPPLTGQVVTLGHHLLEDGAGIILPEDTILPEDIILPDNGGPGEGQHGQPAGPPPSKPGRP